jgi:hypothetical protein
MMHEKDQPIAARVAILLYMENGNWQSKGWIRRKLVAEGYQIDPLNNDWLMNVLNALVHEHRLYHRKNGIYHEYRVVQTQELNG